MKTLNEASAGSGENTLLIGSSPVVGTTLIFFDKAKFLEFLGASLQQIIVPTLACL